MTNYEIAGVSRAERFNMWPSVCAPRLLCRQKAASGQFSPFAEDAVYKRRWTRAHLRRRESDRALGTIPTLDDGVVSARIVALPNELS